MALDDSPRDVCGGLALSLALRVVVLVLVGLIDLSSARTSHVLTISSPMISSIKSSTVVSDINQGSPTRKNTNGAATATWGLADEEQMGTAGLEVVERLEAVEVGGGLGQRQKLELGNRLLIVRVVRDKLRSAEQQQPTHSLNQQHSDEVVRLASLVNGNTRKTGEENLVNRLMVEDLVGRERQAVLNRGHDLLDTALVERKHTIENVDLGSAMSQTCSPRRHEEAPRPRGGTGGSS